METSTLVNLLVGALVIWFIYSRFAPVKGMTTITPDELQQRLAGNVQSMLIDVREPGEYSRRHIAGAVNIPLSQLTTRMQEIPRDKEIYLYCQSGMRSKQAAKILSKHGYERLYNLRGGIMGWSGKVN